MSDAGATTEYGSWGIIMGGGCPALRALVDDVCDEHYTWDDVHEITEAYRDAINRELSPYGVTLAGDEFVGPYPRPDSYTPENLAEIVRAVHLDVIIREHDRG
jgi:hypothetical protein